MIKNPIRLQPRHLCTLQHFLAPGEDEGLASESAYLFNEAAESLGSSSFPDMEAESCHRDC